MEDYRNPRPVEESSKLPLITLLVLIAMVFALLFVGWQSMRTDTQEISNLKSERPTDGAMAGQNGADVAVSPTPEETTEDIATDEKKKQPEESEKVVTKEKPKVEKTPKKETEVVKEIAKPLAEVPKGGQVMTHTVQAGETFYGIANRYNLKKDVLQKLNPDIKPEGIKVGVTKLKVKVKAIHTVGAGDILRIVAQKYGVSKQAIMDANKKTKDLTERGEQLIIPMQ